MKETINPVLLRTNEQLQEQIDALKAENERLKKLVDGACPMSGRCDELKAEVENLTAERGHYKAGWDGCKAEVERLKAPHAKDCAFLLNGEKPGRWDCDCDASELTRERERSENLMEALKEQRRVWHDDSVGCKAECALICQALLAAKQDEGNG